MNRIAAVPSPVLTLALSKGRIYDETLPLLATAGIVPSDDPETSRKLILATNRPDVSVIIVRASDVPTYVQHGAADFAFMLPALHHHAEGAGPTTGTAGLLALRHANTTLLSDGRRVDQISFLMSHLV